MPIIYHRFLNHLVSPETEILILGTFNPDIPNGPTFFYGRPRNFLWQLLPGCWALPSLKNSAIQDKHLFMATYKIDFVDLIASVDVPFGEEGNVNDIFIDGLVYEWKNINALINNLSKLKAVYFTRTTFGRIPNITERILAIQIHCGHRNVRFCLLKSPARFANNNKQEQWINTIIDQSACKTLV